MKKSTVVLLVLAGMLLGAAIAIPAMRVTEKNRLLASKYEDWLKLSVIMQKIDEMYVDTVDHEKVTDAAVSAALAALDPHSTYMLPQKLEETQQDLDASFSGIGIQFNVPNDTAVVIEVIAGGPAERVGMQAGDRLLKVGSTDIAGVNFPQDSMVRRIKGPTGSKVLVTVSRGGEVIPFEMVRARIPTHSVDAAFMVSDSVGFIRLSKFARTTADEFTLAALNLGAEGARHLIVDLRDNGGGYMDQALKLSNLFLERGKLIVYMEGRRYPREESRADGRGPLQNMGLSLLVSEGTASSSEIFGGAMQDNGRATLVGRRTFGKGLVQEPVDFRDGSGVRITVARFYTPSGRCIQKAYDSYEVDFLNRYAHGEMLAADSMKVESGGIVPDVFVPIDTTKVGPFYLNCNRKATSVRFSSDWFDAHKAELQPIDDYNELVQYLDRSDLEKRFLAFAKNRDGLAPTGDEWEIERPYMLTQVRALIGRYSKLGDNAFYHLYLDTDTVYKAAVDAIGR
ncbi:MAG: PDZ domain-containing protein [Bacteroidales bacterium]|nr:PDZ domain-containing protein [Bacteroidales bacterium]